MSASKKTGILLLGFGGPQNLKQVRPFLKTLFSDPALFKLPTFLRTPLGALLSFLKTSSSKNMYAQIGGGSPQVKWTLGQEQLLQNQLDQCFPQNYIVKTGMIYLKPSILEALLYLKNKQIRSLILLPLFPHYSLTTTGAAFSQVKKHLLDLSWNPHFIEIQSFCHHPIFLSMWKQNITTTLKHFPMQTQKKTLLLFSAHALPMSILLRGDPYLNEIEETVSHLSMDFHLPSLLSFQSKNGPIPWLKPYTDQILNKLASQTNIQNLIFIPISFLSDHIETLYEIDILFHTQAKHLGFHFVERAPTFQNQSERMAILLKQMVLDARKDPKKFQKLSI